MLSSFCRSLRCFPAQQHSEALSPPHADPWSERCWPDKPQTPGRCLQRAHGRGTQTLRGRFHQSGALLFLPWWNVNAGIFYAFYGLVSLKYKSWFSLNIYNNINIGHNLWKMPWFPQKVFTAYCCIRQYVALHIVFFLNNFCKTYIIEHSLSTVNEASCFCRRWDQSRAVSAYTISASITTVRHLALVLVFSSRNIEKINALISHALWHKFFMFVHRELAPQIEFQGLTQY